MKQWIIDAFQALISNMVDGIMSMILTMLNAVFITPLHMEKLPGFWTLVVSLQGIATVLLGLVAAKEYFVNVLEDVGDMGVNPLILLKNHLIAGVLIWASPYIVLEVLLPTMNGLLEVVQTTFGSVGSLTSDMRKHLLLTGSEAGGTAVAAAIFPEAGFWGGAVIAGCFLVMLGIITFQNGKRWLELFYLVAISPLMAVTKASFSGTWDVWVREVIGCAASQVVQYFSVILAMQWFVNGFSMDAVAGQTISTATGVVFSLGACFFAIEGPRSLRNIISGGNQHGFKAITQLAMSGRRG